MSRIATLLRRRIALEGYLGRHLLIGLPIMITTGWLFAEIAAGVVSGSRLTLLDTQVSSWLHARAGAEVTAMMFVVTALGGGAVITAFAVIVASYLWWRRQWYWLMALLLTIPGGALLNVMLKLAFQRPRPHFADPITVLTTYSFPSGHTMAATIAYGLTAALVASQFNSWRRRAWPVLGAGLIVVTVAFSRVYLGAHYLSDVIAAMVAGIAWLTACLTAVETVRRRKANRALPQPGSREPEVSNAAPSDAARRHRTTARRRSAYRPPCSTFF